MLYLGSLISSIQKWDETDRRLHASLRAAEDGVRARLLDNFDYPGAMASLFALVSEANKYMAPTRTGEVQTIIIKVLIII
jgi:cysteinyl-tRNA synthetase